MTKIHENALRIVYKGTKASFHELLARNNSVPIHKRNLQLMMIEVCKTKKGLNPPIMEERLCQKNEHIKFQIANGAQKYEVEREDKARKPQVVKLPNYTIKPFKEDHKDCLHFLERIFSGSGGFERR